MVARVGINEVMCSKDTVREESIGDEKTEKDVTTGVVVVLMLEVMVLMEVMEEVL